MSKKKNQNRRNKHGSKSLQTVTRDQNLNGNIDFEESDTEELRGEDHEDFVQTLSRGQLLWLKRSANAAFAQLPCFADGDFFDEGDTEQDVVEHMRIVAETDCRDDLYRVRRFEILLALYDGGAVPEVTATATLSLPELDHRDVTQSRGEPAAAAAPPPSAAAAAAADSAGARGGDGASAVVRSLGQRGGSLVSAAAPPPTSEAAAAAAVGGAAARSGAAAGGGAAAAVFFQLDRDDADDADACGSGEAQDFDIYNQYEWKPGLTRSSRPIGLSNGFGDLDPGESSSDGEQAEAERYGDEAAPSYSAPGAAAEADILTAADNERD